MMISSIDRYSANAYNMIHNNRGNTQKTKEFNEFVDSLDINVEPEWLTQKNGEEYKISKELWQTSVNSLKDMRKDGLSIMDLFYKNDKPTIWGKIMGPDNTLDDASRNELKDFLYKSGAVDLMLVASEGRKLLDSTDLSIDEFKQKWTEWVKTAKVKTSLEEKASTKEQDVLVKSDNQKPFNPIQSLSKNTQTYDINKDTKFAYQRELLKREQERGIDVLHLMQKLEENGEKVVDKII